MGPSAKTTKVTTTIAPYTPTTLPRPSTTQPQKTAPSPNPATNIAQIAAGSIDRFPARKWYVGLIAGAPRSGITIAFIANLNATPKLTPAATASIQLLGRI